MPRLRRRRAAEPREHERGRRDAHRAEHEGPRAAAHRDDAEDRRGQHREHHGPPAGRRVAERAPEVARHGAGSAELLAAPAHPDLEAVDEDEVGQPERDADDEHDGARHRRLLEPVATRDEHVRALTGEQQHRVRVRRDGDERGDDPERPPSAAPALERGEEGERADERAAEEEAVHPPVDPVEEEEPARGDEGRGEERDGAGAPQPERERRDERQARDREERGDEAQAAEPEPEVRDAPGEHEVEWRAAALLRHVLDDAREAVPTHEERERLVLVRRPRHQLVEEEDRGREGDRRHADPEPPLGRERAHGDPRGVDRLRLRPGLDPLRHRGFRHLRW